MSALYDIRNIGLAIIKVSSLEEFGKRGYLSDGIYQVSMENTHIDILYEATGRDTKGIALVCFTAAVFDRKKKIGPFFSGRGLSKVMNLPLISIADPVVSVENINLAWYAGSEDNPKLQIQISKILDSVASLCGYHTLILIGGSGAGFASLIQLSFDTDVSLKALVWNPQTSITKYFPEFVDEYTKEAFKESLKIIKNEREKCRGLFDNHNIKTEVNPDDILSKNSYIYLQNYPDTHHYKEHLIPFIQKARFYWERIGDASYINDEKNGGVYVADWGGRHSSPPFDLIVKLINKLSSTSDVGLILKSLEQQYIDVNLKEISISLYKDDNSWDFNIVTKDRIVKVKVYFKGYRPNCQYAFYLLRDGKRVSSIYYQSLNYHQFDITNYKDISNLSIKVFVKLTSGEVLIKTQNVLI